MFHTLSCYSTESHNGLNNDKLTLVQVGTTWHPFGYKWWPETVRTLPGLLSYFTWSWLICETILLESRWLRVYFSTDTPLCHQIHWLYKINPIADLEWNWYLARLTHLLMFSWDHVWRAIWGESICCLYFKSVSRDWALHILMNRTNVCSSIFI